MFTSSRSNTVLRTTATLALALAGLVGQAAHADNLNPILGGGLGAMTGAFIGQSMGGRDGAMIGAAVGGVAGVSIASEGQRRYSEPARTTVYQQRPVVVYEQPYRRAPVYGYREVERVSYYPVHDYGRRGWGEHGRGFGHGRWDHREEYRRDGYRHGGDRGGYDRHD